MSSFISEALKSAQSSSVDTVSILDVQQEIGFTDLRLVHLNTGGKVLHLVCADDRYLSIGFGKSAITEGSSDLEIMRSAINNNLIYTGDTDAHGNKIKRWFSFGKKGSPKPATTVKFSDLMKEGNVLSGTAVAFAG